MSSARPVRLGRANSVLSSGRSPHSRANVSWESLAERYVENVQNENQEEETEVEKKGPAKRLGHPGRGGHD